MGAVRIAGTGSCIPEHVVSNDQIASFIEPHAPGKGSAWAREKLGILARRAVAPLDALATLPDDGRHEIELASAAALAALERADLDGNTIDGLWYVSATRPGTLRSLSRGAFLLHRHLGLRPEAFALDMDAGCGGATYATSMARQLILGGAGDTVLVIAANVASPHLRNAEAYLRSGTWLPLYVFGDGAGAIVLRRGAVDGGGILAAYTALDPSMPLMEFRPPAGGGEPLFFGCRMTHSTVGLMLRTLSAKAGIPTLNAHSLRHKFGSDAAEMGMNNSNISDLMGHASLSSSFVYTHLRGKQLGDAHRKMKGSDL